MKESEYFYRALADADYRRDRISELREHRKILAIVLGGMLVFATIDTVYNGVVGRGWMREFGSLWCSVTIAAWVHASIKTRLAALEVMDGKAPNVAAKTTEPVTG